MDPAGLLHRIQLDLLSHHEQYKLCVKAAAVAVLFYVGFTDLRTLRIPNETVLLLLVLYVIYVLIARSWVEILWNVVLGGIMFGVLLILYGRRVLGGGDVKLLSVAALWVGTHGALVFSVLLLSLICAHVFAVKMGWAPAQTTSGRTAIPYAPSVAGALIGTILLGGV